MTDKKVALVVGVTGIIGLNLSNALIREGWVVYGLSRTKKDFLSEQVKHVAVDLTSTDTTKKALEPLKNISHVFIATWLSMPTEAENCKVNAAIVANLLDNLPRGYKHVVLVTGGKHYIGSFEVFATVTEERLDVPFKEDGPRLPGPNFYYDQEDVVFDRAPKYGFTWSVARPPAVIGYAPQNQMNFVTSLAVYASICKYLDKPLEYPGNKESYYTFNDMVDAGTVLADHLIWQATSPKAANQAFNVSNGDIYRFKTLWPKIAEYFGLKSVGPTDPPNTIANKPGLDKVWEEIAVKYDLKEKGLSNVTTLWMLDTATSVKVSTPMDTSKSREAGFLKYHSTDKAIFNLFDLLKEKKIIPSM